MNHEIVIALPLEEELLKPLYEWGKRFDWSHVTDAHFVHVIKKTITPLEYGLIEIPDESTLKEMTPTLNKFLEDEAKKILPTDYSGRTYFHLEADFSPDEEMTTLLKKIHADLIVVSTRGKHGIEGLFHSSFTDHMTRSAPCDVFVVRPSA